MFIYKNVLVKCCCYAVFHLCDNGICLNVLATIRTCKVIVRFIIIIIIIFCDLLPHPIIDLCEKPSVTNTTNILLSPFLL